MTTVKIILDHEIVQIVDDGQQYRVFIAMKDGDKLEHNPFPHDLRGLIAAMDLATNCMAGKFFPMAVVHAKGKEALKQIPAGNYSIDVKKGGTS